MVDKPSEPSSTEDWYEGYYHVIYIYKIPHLMLKKWENFKISSNYDTDILNIILVT